MHRGCRGRCPPRWLDGGDDTREHADGGFDFGAGIRLGEDAERLREQAVAAVEALRRVLGVEVAGAVGIFQAREEQRVGECLRVDVGEFLVVGVREKVFADLGAKMRERAAFALDGGEDIGAQQTAERGEHLREPPRLVRDDGLPGEEIEQQRVERGERGVVEGGGSLFHDAVEADEDGLFVLLGLNAGAVERPFEGVGIEDVWKRAEFLPLPLVAVFEFLRLRAKAGSFQLDETA